MGAIWIYFFAGCFFGTVIGALAVAYMMQWFMHMERHDLRLPGDEISNRSQR